MICSDFCPVQVRLAEHMFCPSPFLASRRVMIEERERRHSLTQRVLGAVDLAIDFATLGEYGLEHVGRDGRSGGSRS